MPLCLVEKEAMMILGPSCFQYLSVLTACLLIRIPTPPLCGPSSCPEWTKRSPVERLSYPDWLEWVSLIPHI